MSWAAHRLSALASTCIMVGTGCERDTVADVGAPQQAVDQQREVEPPQTAPTPQLTSAPQSPSAPHLSDRPDVQATWPLLQASRRQPLTQADLAEFDQQLHGRCPSLPISAKDVGGLQAWALGEALVLERRSLGGVGMYDFFQSLSWDIYDAASCHRLRAGSDYPGGVTAFGWSVEHLGAYANDSVIASLLGQRVDCEDPAHGFACRFLDVDDSCDPNDEPALAPDRDWDLVRLTTRPSPWVDGPRAKQVVTFWTPDQFWGRQRKSTTREPELGSDLPPGATLRGFTVAAARTPRFVRKVGRYRLYEATIPVKGEGIALLMRDDQKPRHRWLGHTRRCLLANSVEWLIAGEHLVVGWAHHSGAGPLPAGSNGLFVVDLRHAIIYRMRVREIEGQTSSPGAQWYVNVEDVLTTGDRALTFESGLKVEITDLRAWIDGA